MLHPRVLFIAPFGFNKVTGGGILFSNLISDWPNSHIAIVHHDLLWDDSKSEYNSYRLSKHDIRFARPFSFFLTKSRDFIADLPVSPITAKCNRFQPFVRYIKQLLRYLFLASIPERSFISRELLAFVDEFKPDVIYSTLGSNALMEIVCALQKHTTAPLCIHIMDDWITSNHSHGLFSFYNRSQMRRLFIYLLRSCNQLLTISQAMSNEYSHRYSIDSLPIMNCIPKPGNYKLSKQLSTSFVIVYVGSVLQNAQLSSIIDIASAVSQLNAQNLSLEFHVYCNSAGQQLLQDIVSESFRLFPLPMSDADYFSVIQNASLLVLPTNFDKNSYSHIKYSMPAKLPSYLSSSTPILLYGPPGSAQSDYAHECKWALVVNYQSISMLKRAIMKLYYSSQDYSPLAENALHCFNLYHQASSTRSLFKAILLNLKNAS